MTIALRPYQHEAVGAVLDAFAQGVRRPAVVMATGLGKTVVFADLVSKWQAGRRLGDPDYRVMVLAHRDELMIQAVDKLRTVARELRVGVIKGPQRDVRAPVIVASVQSLRSEASRAKVRDVGLIVVDEAHHATAATYRAILAHYGVMEDDPSVPGAFAVGFTATMSRSDGAALGEVWQKVVVERDIKFGTRNGFLVPPRGIRVTVPDLDLTRVRRVAGDFSADALGDAMERALAPEVVARAYVEHAATMPGFLFAPTVHSAELFAEAFREQGIATGFVHGAMPVHERRRVIADFRDGRLQVVTNCMVLTEGTDVPRATCAVLARPTTSTGLYVQMAGRVLRPHPGKLHALLMDVAGVTTKHRLANITDLDGEARYDNEPIEDDPYELELPAETLLPGAPTDPETFYAHGPVQVEHVDLFGDSPARWLVTPLGVMYVPTGERFIALIPSAKGWMVVSLPTRYDGSAMSVPRMIAMDIESLGYAMAHAEGDLTPAERNVALKSPTWRRRPPSDKMVNYASSLGIVWDGIANAGVLSDQISVKEAHRRIDRHLPVEALALLALAHSPTSMGVPA